MGTGASGFAAPFIVKSLDQFDIALYILSINLLSDRKRDAFTFKASQNFGYCLKLHKILVIEFMSSVSSRVS